MSNERQYFTCLFIIMVVLLSALESTTAKPTYYDSYIGDYPTGSGSIDRFDEAAATTTTTTNFSPDVKRLRRGYYYIEDGYITAIPASSILSRRADGGERLTPVVKYKRTHAKRKKLFVPNFFG